MQIAQYAMQSLLYCECESESDCYVRVKWYKLYMVSLM